MPARAALLAAAFASAAANLFTLTDRYTADPAPFVSGGRVYIFTSHDYANQTNWNMCGGPHAAPRSSTLTPACCCAALADPNARLLTRRARPP